VGDRGWLAIASATMAGAQFVLLACASSAASRPTASSCKARRACSRPCLRSIWWRAVSCWPSARSCCRCSALQRPFALALRIGAEILGRYLFFVSVVPKHMAAPYVRSESEAA
jgi:hypothetical protein